MSFVLMDLLRSLPKGGTVVEVGVFQGGLSEHLDRELQPSKLILIDTWNDCGPYNGEESYQTVQQKFAGRDNVVLMRGLSHDMIPLLEDGSVSVAFIDADHAYEAALGDMEAMYPKLKSGGWLCGHDYCILDDYGVVRAVAVFCDRHKLKIDVLTNEPLVAWNPPPHLEHAPPDISYDSFGIQIP